MTYNSQKAAILANQLNHLHLLQVYFVSHGYQTSLDTYSDYIGVHLVVFYNGPKLTIPHDLLCSGIKVQYYEKYGVNGQINWVEISSDCFPSLTDEE